MRALQPPSFSGFTTTMRRGMRSGRTSTPSQRGSNLPLRIVCVNSAAASIGDVNAGSNKLTASVVEQRPPLTIAAPAA
jgi:hypothetical protein